MRPRGEVRALLAGALQEARSGSTALLAERTQVGRELARRTLDNMRRADEVVVLRTERVPGACRPVPVYALARPVAPAAAEPELCLAECWADWPGA